MITQELGLTTTSLTTDEIQPLDKYIKQLRNDPDYEYYDLNEEFPILTDFDVRQAIGHKGYPFGSLLNQITYRLFFNSKLSSMVGVIYYSRACEGPVACVHGGAIATGFDNFFGSFVLRLLGFGCVTLNLNINYRKFIPLLPGIVRVEGTLDKVEGRKVHVKGSFKNIEGDIIHAESTALFYKTLPRSPSYEVSKQLFGKGTVVTREIFIDQVKKSEEKRKKREEATKDAKKLAATQSNDTPPLISKL